MTYLWLALAFIAAAAVAGVIFARQGARPGEAGKHWKAVGLAFAALAVLTAVFDSVMIGMELFHYDSSHILGLKIGLAPIEDFAYPLAGVVALPGLWMWLTRKRKGSSSSNLKASSPSPAGVTTGQLDQHCLPVCRRHALDHPRDRLGSDRWHVLLPDPVQPGHVRHQ